MSTRVAVSGTTALRTAPLARAAAALVRTGDSRSIALVRVVAALVVFPHGAQHALGWFGGYGFAGTHGWMVSLGFPSVLAAAAIGLELVAPIALLAGLGGRLAALAIGGIMVGAIRVHAPSGFFMNWFGQLPAGAEGYEYHLLVLAMVAAIVIEGSGALSVDRLVARRIADR